MLGTVAGSYDLNALLDHHKTGRDTAPRRHAVPHASIDHLLSRSDQ